MDKLQRGKQIFDAIVEYPLPRASGVRDYVFHVAPASDGYGKSARYFFGRFYRQHASVAVGSLEEVIARLHADVTTGGVQQIREIVIVSHGNPLGLLMKTLANTSSSEFAEYKYLTDLSLARLQKDFDDGKFAVFRAKRRAVVAHLQDTSWVTVRACNFGQSRAGLYALYSFFGGKANVYAPRAYQFFGAQPVMQGMRLESRLEVHAHLSKQRFLAKDVHTADRSDAVVRASLDPAQFAEAFRLASMKAESPAADEQAAYEALVDDLNAGRLAKLAPAFGAQDLALSANARAAIVQRDTQWRISDRVAHAGASFGIDHEIYESIETPADNRRRFTLFAQSHLADSVSVKEFLPIQLFLQNHDSDEWRGKRFTLAFDIEGDATAAAERARFDAMLAMLNAVTNAAVAVPAALRAAFQDKIGVELPPQARIRLTASTGPAAAKRSVWTVEGAERFEIKLEHPASSDGAPTHTLTVYDAPAAADALRRAYQLMAGIGTDPDTPGTELAAYFDRFGADELADCIDYLNAPYKPANVVVLHHAQQALARKKDSLAWLMAKVPDFTKKVLSDDPYSGLSIGQHEDYRSAAYAFGFNEYWREVKASDPPAVAVKADLFAEENLAKRLKIADAVLADRREPTELDPDSPYTDPDDLRALEKAGLERFFSTDKFTFDAPAPTDVGCADFAAVIAKWKEVENFEPAEIKRVLEGLKTADGTSYFDVIKGLKSKYNFIRHMAKMMDLFKLPSLDFLPLSAKDVAKLILKKTPFFARIVWLQAVLEVEFVITIPLAMWLQFIEDQQDAVNAWKARAKVTAIRQWLRALESLTFRRESDFPDDLQIDISTPVSAEPYHIGRYYQEQIDEWGRYHRFVFAPDTMKAGYDAGAQAMTSAGIEILRAADAGIDEYLRESGLDACKTSVLIKAGMLEIKKIKAHLVREIARQLLDRLPKV